MERFQRPSSRRASTSLGDPTADKVRRDTTWSVPSCKVGGISHGRLPLVWAWACLTLAGGLKACMPINMVEALDRLECPGKVQRVIREIYWHPSQHVLGHRRQSTQHRSSSRHLHSPIVYFSWASAAPADRLQDQVGQFPQPLKKSAGTSGAKEQAEEPLTTSGVAYSGMACCLMAIRNEAADL